MATRTASAAESNVPAKSQINGDITVIGAFNVNATNLSSGDVVQMVKVPNGAVILDMTFLTDVLTGGNYTVTIGDGNTANRFFTSLSTGSTSSINRLTLVTGSYGYAYTAEDTVDITFSTVTTATATGTFKLSVTYTMDPPLR